MIANRPRCTDCAHHINLAGMLYCGNDSCSDLIGRPMNCYRAREEVCGIGGHFFQTKPPARQSPLARLWAWLCS